MSNKDIVVGSTVLLGEMSEPRMVVVHISRAEPAQAGVVYLNEVTGRLERDTFTIDVLKKV